MTARSDTNVSHCEAGTITNDERMSGWGSAAGILDFEPNDGRGNVSKAVQIRGRLPTTL